MNEPASARECAARSLGVGRGRSNQLTGIDNGPERPVLRIEGSENLTSRQEPPMTDPVFEKPISDLHRRMLRDMAVRRFDEKTQHDYIRQTGMCGVIRFSLTSQPRKRPMPSAVSAISCFGFRSKRAWVRSIIVRVASISS